MSANRAYEYTKQSLDAYAKLVELQPENQTYNLIKTILGHVLEAFDHVDGSELMKRQDLMPAIESEAGDDKENIM